MTPAEESRFLFEKLNACVLIPTYNNQKTLQRVIDNSLIYTDRIVIVNDGSTDETNSILSNYTSIKQVHFPENCGKGKALKVGFETAREEGYDYVITIDSDGQHFPEDFIVFLRDLDAAQEPILLIGERNMTGETVPKKSSFGNKFSNFWFKVETGISLTDTQSGYRLYPLNHIPKRLVTNKFELEIEVIVRSAWRGISVKNVPVKILYDPNERVSHFRPFKDFTRISILNTILVLITFLYIYPRNFFRSFKKKSIKKFVVENILQTNLSPLKIASSLGLGVAIGFSPLWGLHTFLAIFLPHVFGLSKVLCFAASNVSIPPMIPFILIASLHIGAMITGDNSALHFPDELTIEFAKNHLLTYLVGSFSLALIGGLLVSLTTFILLSFIKRR